jgi:hypothetical protein
LVGALGVVAGTELIRRAPTFRAQPGDQHVDAANGPLGESVLDMDATDITDVPARVA